jgi:hypothetical protein
MDRNSPSHALKSIKMLQPNVLCYSQKAEQGKYMHEYHRNSNLSRAPHRHIYSFFTALRAPLFIHIFTQTHHIPLPQLAQAVTQPMIVKKLVWSQPTTAAFIQLNTRVTPEIESSA